MRGKLKSLGLSGARKAGREAMRKLFGRESSTVNGGSYDADVESPKSASGNSGPPAAQDSHLDPDALVTSEKHTVSPLSTDSNHKNELPTSQPDSTSGTTVDMTMRTLQPRNLQQQRLPPKNTNEADRFLATAPGKENQAPPAPAPHSATTIDEITKQIRDVSLIGELQLLTDERPLAPEIAPEVDEETRIEQAKHLALMGEALEMARLALRTNETPVGCVLVRDDKVIARGMNATNVTRNGTRHAEFMALSALISIPPKKGPRTTCLKPKIDYSQDDADDDSSTASPQPDEGNEDGRKGHLYPYGQKEHPSEFVHPDIIKECTLYVTVEPCIMCASLLRQMGIKKVYFGAVNDKFGGTGGVFSIHANSQPVLDNGQSASAHPQALPTRLPGGGPVLGLSFPPRGGDGGNVEPGFEIEGGWGRDDAVALLRRFYVQENERAPIPRKKEGRAARLAAMMQEDSSSDVGDSAGTQMGADGDDITYPSASEAGDAIHPLSGDDEPSIF